MLILFSDSKVFLDDNSHLELLLHVLMILDHVVEEMLLLVRKHKDINLALFEMLEHFTEVLHLGILALGKVLDKELLLALEEPLQELPAQQSSHEHLVAGRFNLSYGLLEQVDGVEEADGGLGGAQEANQRLLGLMLRLLQHAKSSREDEGVADEGSVTLGQSRRLLSHKMMLVAEEEPEGNKNCAGTNLALHLNIAYVHQILFEHSLYHEHGSDVSNALLPFHDRNEVAH